VNRFPEKKQNKLSNLFRSRSRNQRVCITCAIRYNLVNRPVTKLLGSRANAQQWLDDNFVVASHHETVTYSRNKEIMLFRGISYRSDDWQNHRYIFSRGFVQRSDRQDILDGLFKFSKFTGKSAGGHTASYGISTTTSFDYACSWSDTRVYALDLRNHPFAVDIVRSIQETLRFKRGRRPPRENYEVQAEVNVANRIAPEMIIGVYSGRRHNFIHNTRYDPNYGAV